MIISIWWEDNPIISVIGWVLDAIGWVFNLVHPPYFKDDDDDDDVKPDEFQTQKYTDDLKKIRKKWEELRKYHPEIYREMIDGSITRQEALEKMDEVEKTQEKINDGSYFYELSEEELEQEWEEEDRNIDDGT